MSPRLLSRLAMALLVVSCSKVDNEVFDGSYVGDGVDSQSEWNVKECTLNVSASGTTVSGIYRIKAVILDTLGSVSGTLSGADLTLTLTSDGSLNLKKK